MRLKTNILPLTALLAFLMIVVTSCKQETKKQEKLTSLVEVLHIGAKNHQLLFAQRGDSLYEAGLISETFRDYMHAYQEIYVNADYKKADSILQEVLKPNLSDRYDRSVQIAAAQGRIMMLNNWGQFELSVMQAIDALKRFTIEDAEVDVVTFDGFTQLYISMGCYMTRRGNSAEGETYFEKAYQVMKEYESKTDDKEQYLIRMAAALYEILRSYTNSNEYDNIIRWSYRCEQALADYGRMPGWKNPIAPDMMKSTVMALRARALQMQGKEEEATKAYKEALTTNNSKTTSGKIEIASYLIAAKRYKEAANIYEKLDSFYLQTGQSLTLDAIGDEYIKKYKANLLSGRRDSATAVADLICQNLDSAITHFTFEKAAEMAAIYDIQQKEQKIAEQETSLMQTRIVALLVAIVLITTIFVVSTLLRRRAAARLNQKNEQLTIANERAEESSRMKTKFIQQISHEFRTPLNILSGFTQVLTAEGMELDKETRDDANRQILENTDRITQLVNKMLELSDVSSRAVIELTDQVATIEIAAEAVQTSGIDHAKHLVFEMQVDKGAEGIMLTTNQQAAARALSLLLDNAMKFTPEGDGQRATLRISATACDVAFIVEDTGIGVPNAEAERIFDEFVQLNEYYDGTGIGLTVARSLAHRLGGNIVLDTTYTAGARFVMTLPINS